MKILTHLLKLFGFVNHKWRPGLNQTLKCLAAIHPVIMNYSPLLFEIPCFFRQWRNWS